MTQFDGRIKDTDEFKGGGPIYIEENQALISKLWMEEDSFDG